MSLIVQTTEYIDDDAQLTGGEYSVEDSIFLDATTLKVTNNASNQVSDIGVIGELQEAPELSESGDRMVIRLTVATELVSPIKTLLKSQDL